MVWCNIQNPEWEQRIKENLKIEELNCKPVTWGTQDPYALPWRYQQPLFQTQFASRSSTATPVSEKPRLGRTPSLPSCLIVRNLISIGSKFGVLWFHFVAWMCSTVWKEQEVDPHNFFCFNFRLHPSNGVGPGKGNWGYPHHWTEVKTGCLRS